ncbi:TPA: hypothetical protein N0F65_011636 [Lagenidium giganteum]|uniref:Myb-like domain-containing protein n=1 Tax=Lagenidium giganteum TaxID=4803 RepID=A0AAV2Z952_9STRA|nr:TPA: hypothetical protein N0F65_011636 [Lagenidium giganteum]
MRRWLLFGIKCRRALKMRAPGWEDPEIAVVLAQLRAHMLSYIYASANAVSEMVQQELPAKSLDSINEMVHSLMRSFGVVLNTKAFRSEVIYDADGKEIYVHSHLYETISSLAENKAGGIWHPDELTWFLKKTKQYRTLLDTKPDTYFRRVQMWGKSIAECRAKFYSLRDVYMNEKQAASQPADAIHEARFKLLTELFEDVPPPKPDVSANQPVCKLSNLWSPDELEILLQCLVDITLDIQQHGHSDKIGQISATLKRSEQSCVTKLQAMHEKYVNKSSYHRAAHLPDCIYDPDTPIHKIFNAGTLESFVYEACAHIDQI